MLFRKIIISATVTSLCFISMASNAFPYNNEWWVNAGLGGASGTNSGVPLPSIPPQFYQSEKEDAENVSGPALEASINFPTTEHQFITGRYLASSGGNFFCHTGCGYFREGGLLYGLMAKQRYGYVSASAGLSYVNTGYTSGTDYLGVNFQDPSQKTIGVPAEIQAFVTPFKYVGIGVIGFGDYNANAPVVGAVLALQFGNLYNRDS